MPAVYRYPLDATGTSPANRVIGELKTLPALQKRAAAPIYGPFFGNHLFQIWDNANNRPLVRDVDYTFGGYVTEASIKYGPIWDYFVILDPSVSAEVRYNYQVLGSTYQNNAESSLSLYNALMNDNRPVDFQTGIVGKPTEWGPPTYHPHELQDLIGFEPLVVAIERLRNAVILSDVPAFQSIVDWVISRTNDVVSEQEIDDVVGSSKTVTFDRLLYALDKLNFNAITLTPHTQYLTQGGNLSIALRSTNMPDGTTLYWTIEHIGTDNDDFNTINGTVLVISNSSNINVSVRQASVEEPEETFRIVIRKNSITGPIIAKTGIIVIGGNAPGDILDALLDCCFSTSDLSPEAYYINSVYDR